MERGGFSGDFLVTLALSSGTSFSAGVWPDVLSSGCAGGCITEIDCNGLHIITYSAMLLGSWEAGCFREVASSLQ